MHHIYLDYAATTPTRPEAIEAMQPFFFELSGNPSAGHSYGNQRSKAPVGPAHGNASKLLGCAGDEVFFTASGTESNNTVIKGVADACRERGNHLICSQIEHSAVLEPLRFLAKRGYEASFVPVDGTGMVDPDAVKKAITPKTILISIMHANNEVGTIQPLPEIGRIAREHGITFHTDAVQSFGHVPINVDEMCLDYLSVSAHKCYGPKGIGALYQRKGSPFTPLFHGGGQERGRRSGTHNIPGIAGFTKAMELAREEMESNIEYFKKLRQRLVNGLGEKCDGVRINGNAKQLLDHIVSITFEGVNNQELLMELDNEGIYISKGAACGASRDDPSHVLLAMGMTPEEAHSSVRLSLGKWNTEDEIDEAVSVIAGIVNKQRRK
ncbi:MAG: cysteine desulfurase [Dehalococcoidales bacterium]|nr:cysteine desulfurase [Dehalococcoidales bacterium]